MTDFRLIDEDLQSGPTGARLIEVLINGADEIAERFEKLSTGLPYSLIEADVLTDETAELSHSLATATWQRLSGEVPEYGFAEAIGRRYQDQSAPVSSVLLHWQILRRAAHLVLADWKLKTGRGEVELLRQMTMMDYAIDRATEAALVGYALHRTSHPPSDD